MSKINPLEKLYGDQAFGLVQKEIEELVKNSNIPFDKKYMELGISFLMIKANQMVEGKIQNKDLRKLVSESFGEAAIYKYNVNGGSL